MLRTKTRKQLGGSFGHSPNKIGLHRCKPLMYLVVVGDKENQRTALGIPETRWCESRRLGETFATPIACLFGFRYLR